jgi:hypothetical protein
MRKWILLVAVMGLSMAAVGCRHWHRHHHHHHH